MKMLLFIYLYLFLLRDLKIFLNNLSNVEIISRKLSVLATCKIYGASGSSFITIERKVMYITVDFMCIYSTQYD